MLVPAIAGAIVCLVDLNTRSLWLDEGSTFAIASQGGAALWHGISHDGGNMLAYYLLMHVVIGLFGDAAWVMRMPSVMASAATGALVAAIARRLFDDPRTTIAAGLLTVISLPLVFWGQDARGYALLVAFTCASFLALIAILQTPIRYEPSRASVIAYVVTLVLAFYVGYDVALVIPAQVVLLLVFRERARVVIGCLAVVAVLCVPLAVMAASRGSGQLFWVTPLSLRILRQAAVTLLSAGLPPNFHDTFTTVATVAVMGLSAVVAIVCVGGGGGGRGPPPPPPPPPTGAARRSPHTQLAPAAAARLAADHRCVRSSAAGGRGAGRASAGDDPGHAGARARARLDLHRPGAPSGREHVSARRAYCAASGAGAPGLRCIA